MSETLSLAESGEEGAPTSNGRRGSIMPVGGAEEKLRDPEILQRFMELSGGDGAKIVVIPTASRLKSTGRRYRKLFRDLGAGEANILPFESRLDCLRKDWLAELDEADGVFLTGGNQLRLSTTIGGTPVARALRRLNRRGVTVAGTSAGAAFMSEHMIAFGEEGPSPRADMVTLAPGLGLLPKVIVAQHFRQRDRLGRLLAALAFNPFGVGVGLDENTAALIGPDDVLWVVGSGAITIVDPAEMTFSSMDSARENAPVCLIGLKIHVLTSGSAFNLVTREATPPTGR
jgi:cyanophycinase